MYCSKELFSGKLRTHKDSYIIRQKRLSQPWLSNVQNYNWKLNKFVSIDMWSSDLELWTDPKFIIDVI